MARRLIVGVVALLVAITTVRNSAVDALADVNPARASAFWSDHPAAEISIGMTQIAQAARARRAASPETFRRIDDAALKAPLAPEPFLVRGVQAHIEGKAMDAAGIPRRRVAGSALIAGSLFPRGILFPEA